ncbi:MAG: metallophosphoesterase [Nanoarchaeota archaeon]
MKINQFEIIDRCLFWPEKKILIVADIHLGYEEYLNELGWTFPKTQFEVTEKIFEKIFEKVGKVSKIIILGDIKHHIGGILREEFGDFYKITNLFRKNLVENGEIIITKGDHDKILEPVIRNYSFVKLVNYYKLDNLMFFHGNKKDFDKYQLEIFDTQKKSKDFDHTPKKLKEKQESFNTSTGCLVIGHFHPAIIIGQDSKRERYKCFLLGKIKKYNKNLIILPSFFPLIEGTNILEEQLLENWLNIDNFDVYVLDENENVYDFGKVKELR